ncbi:hypothetical protein Tco_0867705 [Tanacetum coccineum]
MVLESLKSRILGHEKNELAWGEKYEFQNYELKCREIKVNNFNLELEKVVKERDELKDKIAKWEESTRIPYELLNSQMSARDKTGLGYGTQLNEISNNSETDSEISLSFFISDLVMKSPHQQMIGLDEYAIRKKIIESKTTDLNTKIRASLDRKSTTGGCQFLSRRLISWQCKKQTIVAKFYTEAEYIFDHSDEIMKLLGFRESLEEILECSEELMVDRLVILWLTEGSTSSAKFSTAGQDSTV